MALNTIEFYKKTNRYKCRFIYQFMTVDYIDENGRFEVCYDSSFEFHIPNKQQTRESRYEAIPGQKSGSGHGKKRRLW